VPSFTSGPSITNIGANSITITYSVQDDNSKGIQVILIFHDKGNGEESFTDNNCTKNFSANQEGTPSSAYTGTCVVDSINQGTNVQIRVKATDFSNNITWSSSVSGTTLDVDKPTVTSANTFWTGPTAMNCRMNAEDNVGVVTIYGYRDGNKVWEGSWEGYPNTVFSDTNLTPNTQYTWTVRAVDAAGNISDIGSPNNDLCGTHTTPSG
tara:strand:+ start:124 stop:750 length:627 start_codon:yes stop_codon:yes gene_type:complete